MKNYLLGSLGIVALLLLGGCGSEPKSIEELSKLSKDELKSMQKACYALKNPATAKLGNNPSESDLIKAIESDTKLNNERNKIATEIVNARGKENFENAFIFGDIILSNVAAQATNEEISKFGNSDFAEVAECARVNKVLENLGGNPLHVKEKYQKIMDELNKK